MRKIPTLFVRDPDTWFVTDEVTPGCEWVLAGEGTPTVKFDGTCTMFDGDAWWARREVNPGRDVPDGLVEVEADPVTGKLFGWVPIESSPFVKFWREAFHYRPMFEAEYVSGTYELCGPKINGDPERLGVHRLVRHGVMPTVDGAPAELIAACRRAGSEGVVWHHPDGRRAKLKVRDFPVEGDAS